jgi:hypothetical protein
MAKDDWFGFSQPVTIVQPAGPPMRLMQSKVGSDVYICTTAPA